jgi:ribosomal protein S2
MKKKTTIVLNQLFFYKIYSGTNVKNYPTSLYMFEYILKVNKNINFIDLEKTFYLLKKALKIIYKLSKKKILFVENTFINSNLNIISSTAKACNKKYITEE